MQIRPHPGPQEEFLRTSADIGIYGGAAGSGKALHVDELIPTPSGWKPMGELKPGDDIFDEHGQVTKVLIAHPQQNIDAFKLVFDDGVEMPASSEHLWLTYDASDLSQLTKCTSEFRSRRRASRLSRIGGRKSAKFSAMISQRNSERAVLMTIAPPTGSIKTTAEIAASLTSGGNGRSNHAIPVAGAITLPSTEFPIDPYILGVWLGDGTTGSGAITSNHKNGDQQFIIDEFINAGFHCRSVPSCAITFRVLDFTTLLRKNGLLNNKHIPAVYLRGSYAQRLALLQGLMDTDGTATKNGFVEFTNTNKKIAEGVLELILSLGWKARMVESRATLYGKDCGPKWDIGWTPSEHVFRLPRKQARQRIASRRTTKFRYIVSCKNVGVMPMRCITVANDSGLFLAGKSFLVTHNSMALLMEPLRHINKPGFGAVIFRRTCPEITNEGGLWDTAEKIYPLLGAVPKQSQLEWVWPQNRISISMAHMQHEKDKYNWQGSGVPFIGFDELTHFSRGQFFYMVSRNRLTHDCAVRPYIRATCNPDADGWVADFISWWIDQSTGFPIPERSGKLRWFAREDDKMVWADSAEELQLLLGPGVRAKSVTFIAAKITDNPTLLKQDPDYLSNLHALPRFERLQLLEGNWLVRPTAGMFFQRAWFKTVDEAPAKGRTIRYWDRAATVETPRTNPDWTVGLKMRHTEDGEFYILDVVRFRARPLEVKRNIRSVATQDGTSVEVWLEHDPGQAGISEVQDLIRDLAGFATYANRVTESKVTRALPFSAHCEAGNVHMVRGPWNETFMRELETFADEDELPEELRGHEGKKDQVDAASGAFNMLAQINAPSVR